MAGTLTPEQESALGERLASVLSHFGGAIEYWTVSCISRRELGNPADFIEEQWTSLRDNIQDLRGHLNQSDVEPSDTIDEQIAKLARSSVELREVFDSLINAHVTSEPRLESTITRLAQIWQDVRMRVWLMGVFAPLSTPPALSVEKEAYYQSILDSLFDRFAAVRSTDEGHLRNGSAE